MCPYSVNFPVILPFSKVFGPELGTMSSPSEELARSRRIINSYEGQIAQMQDEKYAQDREIHSLKEQVASLRELMTRKHAQSECCSIQQKAP
jgi:predicted RNase H-like nuclease (RuvC/YqgF family)